MMDGKGAGLRVKSNGENSGRKEYSPKRSFAEIVRVIDREMRREIKNR
jgi:hypothetical protein